MIEAVIYLVVTTISVLYIYRISRDIIPSNKKKMVIIIIALILLSQAINVILHLFGVFKG